MKISRLKLGPKFSAWRPGQEDVAWALSADEPRVTPLNAPTGSGKSLMYIVPALLTGKRTLVLTATKQLQDQLMRDFRCIGLVDVRGQRNYACDFDVFTRISGVTVDAGPCHLGTPCPLRDDGCPYYDRLRLAARSQLVATNYAYHIMANIYGEGLGAFDMVVCDEAHLAPGELSEALAIRIHHRLVQFGHLEEFPESDEPYIWASWFFRQTSTIKALYFQAKQKAKIAPTLGVFKAIARYRRLIRKMELGCKIDPTWILERGEDRNRHPYAHWEPIWPGPYAESYIFQHTPRIVPVSAVLKKKGLWMLGLPAQDVPEIPSPFPVYRRRIYVVKNVRVDFNSWEGIKFVLLEMVDRIVGARLDRQGIIHTGSYARSRFILDHSRHARAMVGHDTASAAEIVPAFKRGRGRVLVSPSVRTGYDFPDDECRYQIIIKVPFPDTSTPLMRARVEDDPDYRNYYAATEISQAVGRGNRSVEDWCEHFIIDDHFRWFFRAARRHFPDYVKEAVQYVEDVPKPPKLWRGPVCGS